MTIVTIELPQQVYNRLHAVAQQRHTTIESVAQEWLVEKSAVAQPVSERDQAIAALRAAGLLVEPSLSMQQLAAESTLSLEEARAILDRTGGKPLSELILEMRGPKE